VAGMSFLDTFDEASKTPSSGPRRSCNAVSPAWASRGDVCRPHWRFHTSPTLRVLTPGANRVLHRATVIFLLRYCAHRRPACCGPFCRVINVWTDFIARAYTPGKKSSAFVCAADELSAVIGGALFSLVVFHQEKSIDVFRAPSQLSENMKSPIRRALTKPSA